MVEIFSLLFLIAGITLFTRDVKLFKIASGVVLYFSFLVVKENTLLQIFYSFIITMVLLVLVYMNISMKKKDIFYFSIPCWLLVVSVMVSVFSR